ncbi:MAG: hypothetical protein AAF408_00795 [Pseudomonadota bacterium]
MVLPVEQTVPRAAPGPVTNQQLKQAIQSAELLAGREWNTIPKADLQIHLNLVTVLAAPVMRECLQHRLAMSVITDNAKAIQDMADRDNVTFLKP